MKTETDWRSMEPNHTVKVNGVSGNFKFRSATFNDEGECISVCVIGGTANHSHFRHFTPDRIMVQS
jgi:hypothetical protein